MILLRTDKGELTFTFDNDDRLDGVFKEWEQLKVITDEEHQEILNTMNTCEWDKKVVYDTDIRIVEKYTPEEKAVILAEREVQRAKSFYESEKAIALRIEEDYRLELESIDTETMVEVKQYIKALKASTLNTLVRPEIMKLYEVI
ncbi:MAG: hypothetical protein ACRCZ2_01455 [Fusobacteriaceae bacterium]